MSRLWNETVKHRANGGEMPTFESKRAGKCGRKKQLVDLADRVKAVPWRKRRSLRYLSTAVSVSPASLKRALDAGELVHHSNPVKPRLAEDNTASR